ncbi:hypothetical protein TIFTF001_000777 [Ficus carica]|uniref:Uncharacterized protein n=1 Tax=Ficus carica TaxID=3494 RepID=A0AA88CPZ0_FICCA|nr:hypothetical protein TIFTF001_000777 [Ficus carica]
MSAYPDWVLVTRPYDVIGEHWDPTRSYRHTRRTWLDCDPSTLPRGMHPGLAGVSPTYCCNTSHRHPPPPTLTGAAPAGADDGHPTVPCIGSETRDTRLLGR